MADDEDISQLLEMVFSPDGDDILLGTSIPSMHHYDDEMIGASTGESSEDVINENYESLDALLNMTRAQEDSSSDDSDDEPTEDDLAALDALIARGDGRDSDAR